MSDDKSARQAARRLFKRVSFQQGALGTYELSSLLSETYEILKIPFKPTQNDLKFYEQVLDADKDGKVTLRDLEAKAVEYLCSNTLISSISANSNYQPTYKKFQVDSKPQYSSIGELSNYSQSQFSQTNQASTYKPAAQLSKYSYTTQNDQGAYNYNYKSSFQNKPEASQGNLSNYGNQTLYTLEKNSTYSKSGYDSIPEQVSESSFQYKSYGQVSGNDYTSSNYVTQSYATEQEPYHATQAQAQNQQQTYQEYDAEQQDRPYSETVRQYLSYVGQVFMAYADQVQYTVTEADVPSLLRDTYAVLGREGYNPSKQDVQTWMKLCDVNQDGKVQFQQYEYFVVKSLERSGLNLYDD